MAKQGLLARVAGKTKQIFGIDTSAGVADAGKFAVLGTDGRWDMSMMPTGLGANTTQAPASEAIGAGKLINFWDDAGVLKMRLADNSNGRQADGFVISAVASAATGTAYPLDSTNSAVTGLTAGARYWLGTAGGVTSTPLDETDVANVNKVSQYVGVAKSATELVTDDNGYVIL